MLGRELLKRTGTREMAPQIKALAKKADALSSAPGAYLTEGEKCPELSNLRPSYIHHSTLVHMGAYTPKQI